MKYEYTDKAIVYMDTRLVRIFSKLKALISYDEVNVMFAVKSIYDETLRMAREVFLRIAQRYYSETRLQKDLRSLDSQWVDELLAAYDPVSKYIFYSEFDRKRMRLAEALIASPTKDQEVKAALRSMSFMLRVYAVIMTDAAVRKAMEDDDISEVKWMAELDSKTCSECWKRDGKIYDLILLPSKPHPNCRCWIEAVDE